MPEYRRLYHPGGTYFFTVNLLDRRQTFLTDHHDKLMTCFDAVNALCPFDMIAHVILPDHLHCIWELPQGDADFSVRWKLIKSKFSRSLPKTIDTKPGRRQGERGIWQRRFWEHLIRDGDDIGNHINYVHLNPLKHGYVEDPFDWPYSSIHKS